MRRQEKHCFSAQSRAAEEECYGERAKRMKFIIVGLGKVGRNILRCLTDEEREVTVLDTNEDKVREAVEKYDVNGFCANGCIAEDLKEAGAATAGLIVAVTASDEQNVLCCMIAKSLGVKYAVARVRDPEYNKQIDFMREHLGVDRLVNPERALAEEVARVIRFPAAEKVYTFGEGKAEIVEMTLPEGCALCGKKLSEVVSRDKRYSVLLAAISRDGETFVPNGNTQLREKDVVNICGKHYDISDFLHEYGMLKRKGQYVMILGANKKSYYLADHLAKNGFIVKIISPNREKCEQMKNSLGSVTVVCADFNDPEVLETEGIDDADAFVTMSDYDENNVMTSFYAKKKGVEKVITVTQNDRYEGLFDSIDLDGILSPYHVVAEEISKYVRSLLVPEGSGILSLYKIADDEAEALEFSVNGHKAFTDKTLREIALKDGVLIAAVVLGKNRIVPNGATTIEHDDLVIIVTTRELVSSLDDVLR